MRYPDARGVGSKESCARETKLFVTYADKAYRGDRHGVGHVGHSNELQRIACTSRRARINGCECLEHSLQPWNADRSYQINVENRSIVLKNSIFRIDHY
jgi:hypothetical protein